MSALVLLLYIMCVPFIPAHRAQPLLTDRSLLPAPMNTYQAPLLFMAGMKSTRQSRSLLCVSSLIVPSSQLLNFVCQLSPPNPNPPLLERRERTKRGGGVSFFPPFRTSPAATVNNHSSRRHGRTILCKFGKTESLLSFNSGDSGGFLLPLHM